jgi:hypothetical protein
MPDQTITAPLRARLESSLTSSGFQWRLRSCVAHKPDLFDRHDLSARMLADTRLMNHLDQRDAAAPSIAAVAVSSTALKDK